MTCGNDLISTRFRFILDIVSGCFYSGDVPHEDDPKRVGATVKALREAYGWTLSKFAVAIPMSHAHLANIEAGRKRLTPEKARAIAETLNVPLAAITTSYDVSEIAS